MKKLRSVIEPDFKTAEQLYPIVLKLISAYTAHCDEFGDEDAFEYQKLENQLAQLTSKDMSQFNLSEWWEEEGIEVLAFNIVLPPPKQIKLTKEELFEIVTRIKHCDATQHFDNDFIQSFYIYTVFLGGYYSQFLALNFKKYNAKLFQRNKDKQGQYFEYSITEIVEYLWNSQ